MIRNALCCVLVLAGSVVAPCQSTFIVQMDPIQDGYDGYGNSVMETGQGFLVFGLQVSADGTGRTRCMVYKLGLDGSYQSHYEIGTGEPYHSSYGFFDPVARMANGGFGAALHHHNGYDSFIELARFDGQGDPLAPVTFMTTIPTDSVLVGTRQMRQTSDGGFVFCGFRDTLGASGSAWLVKLDSNGEVEWDQTYGNVDQLYEGISVAQYPDGGYVMAGYRLPGSLNGLGFVLRTDSAGEVVG